MSPTLLTPPDFSDLVLNLQSKLDFVVSQLRELTQLDTGDDRIAGKLREVLRRAEVDFSAFESSLGSEDALSIGVNALSEIAKGTSDIGSLALGAANHLPPDKRSWADQIFFFAKGIQEDASSWRQTAFTFRALDDAQRAAGEAATAASALKTAAGEAGATRLEEAFEKYAKGERETARAFRAWTIVLLSAVALLGAVAAVLPLFFPEQAEVAWQVVVYRIAVLTAMAGLAAYLGRQSGHHRQAATWAEAIAVQLQAFPAFIQPIQGAKVADEIYEAFGKRVMGSPPDFAGKSDDAMNPTMSALIDALVKQARPGA